MNSIWCAWSHFNGYRDMNYSSITSRLPKSYAIASNGGTVIQPDVKSDPGPDGCVLHCIPWHSAQTQTCRRQQACSKRIYVTNFCIPFYRRSLDPLVTSAILFFAKYKSREMHGDYTRIEVVSFLVSVCRSCSMYQAQRRLRQSFTVEPTTYECHT